MPGILTGRNRRPLDCARCDTHGLGGREDSQTTKPAQWRASICERLFSVDYEANLPPIMGLTYQTIPMFAIVLLPDALSDGSSHISIRAI